MKRDLTERLDGMIIGSALVQRTARTLGKLFDKIFGQTPLRRLKLLANGSWLEHPLHPLLTDVPIGAWTIALLLDLVALVFGVPGMGLAAGIALGVGVLAALGAIGAGFMDWMDIDPPEMAIGLVHAVVNIIATLLFAVAFFWQWATGWVVTPATFVVALVAYLVISVGAYLGGSLVYRLGVMINRNAYRSGPASAVAVMPLADLPENKFTRVDVKGDPVLLWRNGDKISAVGAVCSHYGAPLQEGKQVGDTVQCPWHGSRFSLADGSVKDGPATCPLPAYEAAVVDGQVRIKARAA
jgi:nitrite reductase/ring-hydroxylating ferredoxin subunit/uncharacterized membrane protein